MLLVGPQPVGTWVLVALGFAKGGGRAGRAGADRGGLAALAASLDGDYDAREYFADLDRREHITTMPPSHGGADDAAAPTGARTIAPGTPGRGLGGFAPRRRSNSGSSTCSPSMRGLPFLNPALSVQAIDFNRSTATGWAA